VNKIGHGKVVLIVQIGQVFKSLARQFEQGVLFDKKLKKSAQLLFPNEREKQKKLRSDLLWLETVPCTVRVT